VASFGLVQIGQWRKDLCLPSLLEDTHRSGWAFGFNRIFGSVFAVFEQIRFSKMVTEIGMKI
jgi:hypothetical protein